MGKPRVTFKMQRITEDDWQILAEYPGADPRYIKGLKSKADVDEWLQGTRRIDWLRSQGYAKGLRRPSGPSDFSRATKFGRRVGSLTRSKTTRARSCCT